MAGFGLAPSNPNGLAEDVHIGPPQVLQFNASTGRRYREDGRAIGNHPVRPATCYAEEVCLLVVRQDLRDDAGLLRKQLHIVGYDIR